jgi:hypothetical protein
MSGLGFNWPHKKAQIEKIDGAKVKNGALGSGLDGLQHLHRPIGAQSFVFKLKRVFEENARAETRLIKGC